jgi:ligand-binding sensor domain-containing protein/signal transduction histidine kinase
VVVEARELQIHPDKISPPVVVKASNVIKKIAGRPEMVQLPSNVFPAKITSTTPAGYPKVVFPNEKKYESPRVVSAIDSPYASKPPEVITLDAPYFSEYNRGLFSSIKAKHGLNSNEISSMIQDRSGNLWIGEWWGGICRYDGKYLWSYTIKQGLSSDVVNNILEDSRGNIWIATYDNGVNKFDGKYFTHYSVREGLQDNSVNCMLQDKSGNMWFATTNGLTKFDGRLFTHFTTAQGLPTNNIRSLMEDSDGQLWVGSFGGLTKFDGQSFQNYSLALNLDEHTEVSSLLEDNEKNIWFATNIGLFKYEDDLIKHFNTDGGLSSNAITKIIKENNGDIWIGTRGGGANRYDGKSFTRLQQEQGLPNEIVTSIVQDKWGNIWLGTTAGICRYDGKMFSHIIPIKQDEIEALLADSKGNIWMGSGTDSCLNKYDGKYMMRYTKKDGLSSTRINHLYEDSHGNIWISSWDGVEKYDGKYLTHYTTDNGLVDSVVFCVLEDNNGDIWFGTKKGLSKFDGKFFTNYLPAQGLSDETIFSLLQDHSGNLWIGTDRKGLCRFDGNTFTHYPNSLGHPTVLGMVEDRNNNIWIATSFGIDKFDGKNFTWYTTEQGLTNNIVKDVLEDKNGDIWVGTINGLNRYTPKTSTSDTFRNGVPSYFKTYTTADGFSGAGTYENAMRIDKRGNIWIGSNDRLTLYHPEGDVKDTIPPVLKLTGITLSGEKTNWQETKKQKANFSGISPWYNLPENLELEYNNSFVTFQFIGITTNRPKEVRYRYVLDGLNDTWTSTSQPEAVYNKLPHGKFKFRVQSVNGEGYWSDELNYSFVVFPPWWQTTLAYCIYVIALAAMIWMFSWYRSRSLKAQNILLEEKVARRTNELEQSLEERYKLSEQIKSQQALLNERLRISRDLHDEIGSTLGSISIYSEVAKKRSDKNENPSTVLSKIGTASRELIERMSDIVWSLSLNSENFEQMQRRMRAFATMMLAPRNIRCEFDIDEHSKQIQLTSAQAKNIFLIYKEALYNVVKYADCNSVGVRFRVEVNELIMTIHDNGKGFTPFSLGDTKHDDERLGGNGIKNMHVRSDEIQGSLTVDSKVNAGTTIELRTPLSV